ncbi:hypothetical protein ABZ783_07160 [Micromonospora sp. NPDC047738]|uniref:hypothetical protein n=1 Tax=Micromonospora sp. NPDC047738 TaxID=3155741 RepID=UPI0033D15327
MSAAGAHVQGDLFDPAAAVRDERESVLTPAEKFEQFHADNPAVYATLCRLAREWVDRTGRRKIGIGALTERCRWEIALATNDPEFKINNNHRAFYARLIMRDEPDLADLFELRKSMADEWDQPTSKAA